MTRNNQTLPPGRVGPWDLAMDFKKIRQQWPPLNGVLADELLFDRISEGVSGWSCGQHAGHIALVTHRIAEGIEQNLADPERNSGGEWTDLTRPVFESGGFPRGRAEAPSPLRPGQTDRREFRVLLRAARQRWNRLEGRQDELSVCPARFPHFAFGQLTSTDWVRFCAIHTAHHLRIIDDILAA